MALKSATSRRCLQIATALLALVPVLTGLVGLLGLDDPLYAAMTWQREGRAAATLDSNLRFFSGVWLGLGLTALWLVPRVERETTLFRAVWLMIFLGGIGRLLSIALAGMPLAPFVGFTALEIIGAPYFVWWQRRVARPALADQLIGR